MTRLLATIYIYRVQGKATLSTTVNNTTIENQGKTELCWLFALANVIMWSLQVRVRKFQHLISTIKLLTSILSKLLGEVQDTVLKQIAINFLNRKDLRQKIRRELLFGLFPKTLKGKFYQVKLS